MASSCFVQRCKTCGQTQEKDFSSLAKTKQTSRRINITAVIRGMEDKAIRTDRVMSTLKANIVKQFGLKEDTEIRNLTTRLVEPSKIAIFHGKFLRSPGLDRTSLRLKWNSTASNILRFADRVIVSFQISKDPVESAVLYRRRRQAEGEFGFQSY